jgi:hypothetical protein
MSESPGLVSRQGQGAHLSFLAKPPLSIWQSAVLAYASAKFGIRLASTEQADAWLRVNPQDPQHPAMTAVCRLLAVEPPRPALLLSRRKQWSRHASPRKPTLSIWQSALLAHASAKCGIRFTSIEQTGNWLRANPQDPRQTAVQEVCGLLVVEPPRPAYSPVPPTAA